MDAIGSRFFNSGFPTYINKQTKTKPSWLQALRSAFLLSGIVLKSASLESLSSTQTKVHSEKKKKSARFTSSILLFAFMKKSHEMFGTEEETGEEQGEMRM